VAPRDGLPVDRAELHVVPVELDFGLQRVPGSLWPDRSQRLGQDGRIVQDLRPAECMPNHVLRLTDGDRQLSLRGLEKIRFELRDLGPERRVLLFQLGHTGQ